MEKCRNFAKFVSQKVNKIRWKPTANQFITESNDFATGSWDNEVNKLCIWTNEDQLDENGDRFPRSADDLDVEPRLLCEVEHVGDVTDLLYLKNDQILTASSNGSVHLYKHHSNSQTLSVSHSWPHLHRHLGDGVSPCTALAYRSNDSVMSVGEDGRMCFLSLDQRQPLRVIAKADSCTMNAVAYLKQSEVAVVNSTGQLKVWDVRQSTDSPSRVFQTTGDKTSLQCLDKHPTQPHIVCTGGQDGALTVWDMRQDRFPVTVLNAHSGPMWEVKFHPSHPDNLFTCADDGSVWHWDASSGNVTSQALNVGATSSTSRDYSTYVNASTAAAAADKSELDYTSAWLGSEASKHRMDVSDLLAGNTMPVNTLDIQSTTLICGTDGEQIYTVCDLVIR